MTLAAAQKLVRDLTVLPPDFRACGSMNIELERLVSRYTDIWENDQAGNIYLDITGSVRIFGPPPDCSSRLLRDIIAGTGIQPAAAVACNKLVSKVATRTIRPTGLIKVQNGTEAEFLAHQDIRILPGMGPSLLRIASVTGIREIGEAACLTGSEALALFGKHGPLLRDMALGIDPSRVTGKSGEKRITAQADFNEDITDDAAVMGAIESLAEHGGFAMRRDKLGAHEMELVVSYSDGIRAQGREKFGRPLVFDCDIARAAEKIFRKTALRRIRLRSVGLSLENFSLLGFEPDLFEPEAEAKKRRLQEAADAIQNRYGEGALTKALVLAAMKKKAVPARQNTAALCASG
jgi:DNA polymerase-4